MLTLFDSLIVDYQKRNVELYEHTEIILKFLNLTAFM